MNLNSLFDRNLRRGEHAHRNHNNNGLVVGKHREYDNHSGNRNYEELFHRSDILQRLFENKKLLLLAGILLLALFAVIAVVIIFALPLLGQALDYVDKSGLKSRVNQLLQVTGGAK